ncbi:hypothetical protein NQ176_g4188 [Zarea fungicola]|uniref:Uncharacterized protein n=1 Tax=Zarea fungicola TaxID=93591 RepID=A0ACC1NFT3_9HYPO|nr:hypothetical protein NQ176_g4188 [Lecanicillium fungicola]
MTRLPTCAASRRLVTHAVHAQAPLDIENFFKFDDFLSSAWFGTWGGYRLLVFIGKDSPDRSVVECRSLSHNIMASGSPYPPPGAICSICKEMPWCILPGEMGGHRHHSSRQALEASARTCPICSTVLRAAIANMQPDDAKIGRWRYFRYVLVKRDPEDDDLAAERMLMIRDIGFHQPDLHQEPDTMILAGSGMGMNLVKDFTRSLVDQFGTAEMPLIAHTVPSIDTGGSEDGPRIDAPSSDEKKSNRLSSVFSKLNIASKKKAVTSRSTSEPANTSLSLEHETTNLPVWVYGNNWAEYDKSDVNDISKSKKCIMGFGARFGTSHRIMDAVNNPAGVVRFRGSYVQIYTDDFSPLAPLIPSRLPERDASSELSIHRIRSWIHNCHTNHAICRAMIASRQRRLPTRVIDVSSSDLSAEGVRLWESNGAAADYIALSHTWGKSPRLRTLKSNMKAMLTEIRLADLPKTFQDAVSITRSLGRASRLGAAGGNHVVSLHRFLPDDFSLRVFRQYIWLFSESRKADLRHSSGTSYGDPAPFQRRAQHIATTAILHAGRVSIDEGREVGIVVENGIWKLV